MNLLMISGDRGILQGKKGAFFYTLEELRKYFERIDVICPRAVSVSPHPRLLPKGEGMCVFDNVFFHPSPRGLWYQQRWIVKKGKELTKNRKTIRDWMMTVHDYPPFYNGRGARKLHRKTRIPYALEIHHIVGTPRAMSLSELLGRWLYHRPFSSFFFRPTVRRAHKVRTVNHEVAEVLRGWGIPQWKIHIVPSLYLDEHALTPDPTIPKTYDLVTCARLVPHKGVREIIDAVTQLPGVTLLIIGDGPERPALEARVQKLNLGSRVTFAGWLPEITDVYRAMQSGKIFVMNSRSEGNPRVAIEAMALGVPVLTTPVGIMPQFQAGLVAFTDGSPADLTSHMSNLLSNAALWEKMGKESRNTVLHMFERQAAVMRYATFLQSLPTLLFITQKLHGQDEFGKLWIEGFEKKGYDVKVLCLEKDPKTPEGYGQDIFSMGKEKGYRKARQIWNFYRNLFSLRYDRVFIHMSPVWYALGFPVWLFKRIPVYLWYTHYKMQLGVRLFALFGKRFFCATAQSLPQFEGSPKKIVTGHGIDLAFWVKKPNHAPDPHALLVVHRLSRSKRLEIGIRALTHLPESYTLAIYGTEAEPDYVAELRLLVAQLGLEGRITFKGSIPMKNLPDVYAQHRLIVNMASETIDKSMLEAMISGCYPVTTQRNAEAIGLPSAPEEETPESVAVFIQNFQGADPDELYRIVAERHSLEGMIEKMDEYTAKGI